MKEGERKGKKGGEENDLADPVDSVSCCYDNAVYKPHIVTSKKLYFSDGGSV